VKGRKRLKVKEKNDFIKLPTFYDRENVTGKVIINLNKLKNIEHKGIKIELLGVIENLTDKKNISKFITLIRDLEPPGALNNEVTTLNFSFNNVEKQYETYRGAGVQVRYYLKASLITSMKNHSHEQEFGVINPEQLSVLHLDNQPIKLEVGIEDWLHLVFEVDKSKLHLRDTITGMVVFKKVSIRLKSMEIQIIKRETIGAGQNAQSDNDVITRYEIMDGAPFKSILS
jgi:vacuolar protein sorting-associated protein 26